MGAEEIDGNWILNVGLLTCESPEVSGDRQGYNVLVNKSDREYKIDKVLTSILQSRYQGAGNTLKTCCVAAS